MATRVEARKHNPSGHTCPFIFVTGGTSLFPEVLLVSLLFGVLQCKVVPSAQLLPHSIE